MMTPLFFFSRGAAAWEQKNGALRFTSSAASQISSVMDAKSAWRKLEALLTRMSRRPNSLLVLAKSLSMSDFLARSAGRHMARRPRLVISRYYFLGFRG